MEQKAVITARGLTKKFGSFIAAGDLNFDVHEGEIFGFLGANGAGKTTAMRMLCGLLEPSAGEARIAGFDIYKERESIKKNIGYMSQKFSLYEDLTVKENIRFFGGIYGIEEQVLQEKVRVLIEKLALEREANTRVKSLPPGWRQKLAFSVAVLHEPRIVFLDEPTGGVDPLTRRQFWDLIYEAADMGITVFITTHYMDEAAYCKRISIMVDGAIKALDTPGELMLSYNSKDMEEVFFKLARSAQRSAD